MYRFPGLTLAHAPLHSPSPQSYNGKSINVTLPVSISSRKRRPNESVLAPVSKHPRHGPGDVKESKHAQAWISALDLNQHHRQILVQHMQLEDCHINAFQRLIAESVASQGWQQTAIGGVGYDFAPAPSVQILHNGTNHWLTSASTRSGVVVADSLFTEPNAATCQCLLHLYCLDKQECLEVTYIGVQRQTGSTQCGDFAIAFAAAFARILATGKPIESVTDMRFDQSGMRAHMLECLNANKFAQFPMAIHSDALITLLRPITYQIKNPKYNAT